MGIVVLFLLNPSTPFKSTHLGPNIEKFIFPNFINGITEI